MTEGDGRKAQTDRLFSANWLGGLGYHAINHSHHVREQVRQRYRRVGDRFARQLSEVFDRSFWIP